MNRQALLDLPVADHEPGLELELAKLRTIEAAMAIARRNGDRLDDLGDLFAPEIIRELLRDEVP